MTSHERRDPQRHSSSIADYAAGGRPAAGDREARRRARDRPGAPDAARRDRLGQDIHHRQRDPGGAAADAGAGAQQDARGAALRRVQGVLPAQRGRVLRLATTTTTSRKPTCPRPTPTSRRTPRSTSTSSRCACRRPRRCSSGRTRSSSRRCRRSTAWAIRRRTSRWCCTWSRGDRIDQRKLLRRLTDMQYTRNELDLHARHLPRARRRHRHLPGGVGARSACASSCSTTKIDSLTLFDPLTGEIAAQGAALHGVSRRSHYVTPRETCSSARRSDPRSSCASGSSELHDAGKLRRGAAPRAAHAVRHGDDAARSATATASRTTRATCPAARRASRRRACSTTCRDDALLVVDESHHDDSAARRHVQAAIARARKRWSSTASACRRRSTTGRCGSRSGSSSRRR